MIGSELGEKTPEQIVDYLIKQGLGPGYAGKITLSGCFTASGGPAASKADAPFAEKVLKIFRGKKYAKLFVEAMPGPSITVREDGEKDSDGKAQKRGEKKVMANVQDEEGLNAMAQSRKLSGEVDKLAVAYNKLRKDIVDNRPASDPARANYDNSPAVQEKISKLTKLREGYDKTVEKLKTINESDAMKVVANYKGVFGLRAI